MWAAFAKVARALKTMTITEVGTIDTYGKIDEVDHSVQRFIKEHPTTQFAGVSYLLRRHSLGNFHLCVATHQGDDPLGQIKLVEYEAGTQLVARCVGGVVVQEPLRQHVRRLRNWLQKDGLLSPRPNRSQPKRGMSDWRKRRAFKLKETAEKHPDFTQGQVANRATLDVKDAIRRRHQDEQSDLSPQDLEKAVEREFNEKWSRHNPFFTKHDVRNDFTEMGWDWEPQKDEET